MVQSDKLQFKRVPSQVLLLLSINLSLSAQVQNDLEHKVTQPRNLRIALTYFKITEQQKFPPPYVLLDSLMLEFQDWLFAYPGYTSTVHPEGYKYWDQSDMPYDLLLRFAKVLVWKDFYPREDFYRYLRIANAPSRDQYRRYDAAVARGELFDEAGLPMTGYVLGVYILEKQIKNRLPWEWYFTLKNRYILVVEPLTKEYRWIDPKLKMMKANYYRCKVIQDIKGNFDGPDIAQFVDNYLKGRVTEMEIGRKYLVLVSLRSDSGSYGPTYLIRGLATDGRGIFPVVNGKILDTELKLRTESEITIENYKDIIQNFIHKTAGVPYEE
jgi:hypothetical protein